MKKLFVILFTLASLFGTRAIAQEQVVIELFTSQGCDMCPPAHILQKEYDQKDGVISLTWHVEHWDFMGWRDTYAKPAFSNRQYEYNESFGRKGVYTPQVIINGREQLVGSNKLGIYTGIKNALIGNQTPVDIRFGSKGSSVNVFISGQKPVTRTEVVLVWVKTSDSIQINGGNNFGKTLEFMNIVRSSSAIGTLDNEAQTLVVDLGDPNRGDSDAFAILVQESGVGRIMGAGFYKLEN